MLSMSAPVPTYPRSSLKSESGGRSRSSSFDEEKNTTASETATSPRQHPTALAYVQSLQILQETLTSGLLWPSVILTPYMTADHRPLAFVYTDCDSSEGPEEGRRQSFDSEYSEGPPLFKAEPQAPLYGLVEEFSAAYPAEFYITASQAALGWQEGEFEAALGAYERALQLLRPSRGGCGLLEDRVALGNNMLLCLLKLRRTQAALEVAESLLQLPQLPPQFLAPLLFKRAAAHMQCWHTGYALSDCSLLLKNFPACLEIREMTRLVLVEHLMQRRSAKLVERSGVACGSWTCGSEAQQTDEWASWTDGMDRVLISEALRQHFYVASQELDLSHAAKRLMSSLEICERRYDQLFSQGGPGEFSPEGLSSDVEL